MDPVDIAPFAYTTCGEHALEHRREIGFGAFGKVHEMYRPSTGEAFARKLFYPHVTEEEIEREVHAIKKLCGEEKNKNIVQVLHHGKFAFSSYYVIDMELCQWNLNAYIYPSVIPGLSVTRPDFVNALIRSIRNNEIWNIMKQIASGVDFIHQHKQVHRDLKPANVLYSCKDAQWKVGDFGLTCGGASTEYFTTTLARGTAGYRAPELITDGKGTTKTDIWSMGCIFYELAARKKLFSNDIAFFVRPLSKSKIPVPLADEFDKDDGKIITTNVNGMLQSNPSLRPTAKELFEMFSRYSPSRQTYPDDLQTLSWAAENGDIEAVQILLIVQVRVNEQSKGKATALIFAAKAGHSEVVNMLLGAGAAVAAKDIRGRTALYYAAEDGHRDVVVLLLGHMDGVDVAARDWRGCTALHRAAERGHRAVVALLLEKAPDLIAAKDESQMTALHGAAGRGHTDVVALLLQNGADIAAKDDKDKTALHGAAYNGHRDVVAPLLEKAPDLVAAKDRSQKTALHSAAERGHTDVVALLLEKAPDLVTAKDLDGHTALHHAAANGHADVVALLLQNGADVAAKDERQNTALHRAAGNGHADVVALLLQNGADVAVRHKYGQTALHHAAIFGHADVVALLLQNGADVAAKDDDGKTALHLAAANGHADVVALLLQNGADVAAKDDDGKTALHWAAGNGHKDVVALLLDKMDGAAVAAKDVLGRWTALDPARPDYRGELWDTEKKKPTRKGHTAEVALLLRQMEKADVAAKDFLGKDGVASGGGVRALGRGRAAAGVEKRAS